MMKKMYFLLLLLVAHTSYSQNTEANDCINYIQICGNQSIQLNPTGYGTQEIGYNVCYGSEHNSLWLKFTVKTSGTLGFDLIPASTDINEDYDFWIFGPNVSCGNLGTSIRCSTTNPAAAGSSNNHTGMRDSEPDGDFFEGPGWDGDNYVKSLTVTAGQTYFLVIDRPIGDSAFSLNWTGTATLLDPFDSAPNAFGIPSEITICKQGELFDFSSQTNLILNGNTEFTVSYYTTYDDANYNRNAITVPHPLTLPKYYYRIQSSLSECFQVGEIYIKYQPLVLQKPTLIACKNGTSGIFNLNSAELTSQPISEKKFYSTQAEAESHLPGTEIATPNAYSSTGGKVYAWVKATNGCENITELTLNFYAVPMVDTSTFSTMYCDENFDGKVTVDLAAITPTIVPNSNLFDVVYYLPTNPSQIYTNNIDITGNTTLTVEVKSKDGCPSALGTLNLTFKPKVLINPNVTTEICDNQREGKIDIKLSDYTSLFGTTATATYFKTVQDARANVNPIGDSQTITEHSVFYYRFETSTECPEIGILSIFYKTPQISTVLPTEITICKDETIILDAGAGFDAYIWSTGSTEPTSGEVAVGEYWVELWSNGCVYKQFVTVKNDVDIVLERIFIESNRATIIIASGTSPYLYSTDGTTWQSSNVLDNIPFGTSYVYVKSAIGCIYRFEVLNIKLVNAITPNNDGKNEALDFSGLQSKENVKFIIFDKYGKVVYQGGNNQYRWDGTVGGKVVTTDTYWYILEWIDPLNKQKFQYKSWILVKNRN